VTALLLLAGLVGALTVSARAFPPASPQRQAQLVPSAAWLGAWVQPASYSRQVQQDAVLELERQIGRRLAINHTYVPWGTPLGWRPAWDVSLGRIPLITFGNRGNTGEIVQGRHDVYLRQLAEAVRKLGTPVFLRYAHRMDLASASSWVGSPESYVAAWRHVHEIFAGLPVSWVWTPTAAAFASGGQAAERYYPGDDYVDWIAADGYNAVGCAGQGGWRQLSDVFGDFYAWGSPRGKPLMIAEAGTTEDPADPGRKAAWFDNAARQLATEMPNVQALIYFSGNKACDYRVDTSAQSLQAFKRLAQNPHFQTKPLPPTTTAPSTTKPATTTTRPTATTKPAPAPSPGPGGVSNILAPSSGALWGTTQFTYGLESQVGRKFDIVHFYHQWTHAFPTAEERELANGGRILLLNWKPPTSSGSWAAVASGQHDAQITTTANRLKSFGKKLFLAFHHEPEDNVGQYGSASDYARAFRRIHDVFERAGASNVVWVWNVMGYMGHAHMFGQLYPGDQYVDWIAFDPYNWYGCKSGAKPQSFAEITKPFYDWTAANHPGKPLMLGEWGLREQPAGYPSKGAWFRDAISTLKASRARIKALVYFNNLHDGCDWRITTSSGSVEGYRAAGQDTFVNRLH
jgi:beta-mannanase